MAYVKAKYFFYNNKGGGGVQRKNYAGFQNQPKIGLKKIIPIRRAGGVQRKKYAGFVLKLRGSAKKILPSQGFSEKIDAKIFCTYFFLNRFFFVLR